MMAMATAPTQASTAVRFSRKPKPFSLIVLYGLLWFSVAVAAWEGGVVQNNINSYPTAAGGGASAAVDTGSTAVGVV